MLERWKRRAGFSYLSRSRVYGSEGRQEIIISDRSYKFRDIPLSWRIAINDIYCNLISQDDGIMSLFTPVHMSNAFASVGK